MTLRVRELSTRFSLQLDLASAPGHECLPPYSLQRPAPDLKVPEQCRAEWSLPEISEMKAERRQGLGTLGKVLRLRPDWVCCPAALQENNWPKPQKFLINQTLASELEPEIAR